jgi:hypothetical protein
MAKVESSGTVVRTVGLPGDDFELRVPEPSWLPDGEELLQTIADYVVGTGKRLRAGETFGYGYWLVRFERANGRLGLSESTADGAGFQDGVVLTLRYWREQHRVCDAGGIRFSPPRPDQMAAISAGVYEGEPVQGVRYPAPPHMSGWYLTTSRYDGDIASLEVEHLHHVTAARPDLARFLALEAGARFDTTAGEDVWFDPEVPKG